MTTAAPEVVTLCGSSRFRDAFEREQQRLTLEGRIVISLGVFERPEGPDASTGVEVDLGELHKRKIDLSDRIHVVNVVATSAAARAGEIEYAQRRGIAVTYMEF